MKNARLLTRLLLLVSLCFSVQGSLLAAPAGAPALAPQAGTFSITLLSGPNLVVDSNVESPSTYAPRSALISARVCNTGNAALDDVFVSVGNYTGNLSTSTPGIYPARSQAPLVGSFSLTHEGGSSGTRDATRFLLSLAPGACTVQYWVVSYPRLDDLGNTVTGGIKPDDDLWVEYDVWASANNGSVSNAMTGRFTMRNEISASANKIWPNGDNKVPDQYLNAIASAFGWGTFVPGGGSTAYPGTQVSTQGIWYDLGVVGHGFDNDGDFVPDHNAWLQPIGDPSLYDPGCFRLVRTYGLLIVKLIGGGEQLIPFVDQLYFTQVPDNTGVVGLVFYEYVALDGVCGSSLSPYQEVASGFDNEKFSGDYGHAMPPMQTVNSPITMDKTVDLATAGPALPQTLSYAISFVNPGPATAGAFSLGMPLVISDTVPLGVTYVAGSATANNTLPAGVSAYRVLFSTDNGITWSATEPPASSVTTIQWWLGADFPANTSGTVRYQATIPGTYLNTNPPVVLNTGALSFGNTDPFTEDSALTVVLGNNSLSGTVFRDNGSAGFFANGVLDSGELGIANVTVSLYLDTNNDGVGDALVGQQLSGPGGAYSFTNLPDGNFVVTVEHTDPDIPTGFTSTNSTSRTVALDPTHASASGVSQSGIDFGFAPALTINKQLTSPSVVYEGDTVKYTINLTNNLPGNGSSTPTFCSRIAWAQVADTTTSGGSNGFFLNRPNVAGAGGPDRQYASSAFANNVDEVRADTFSMSQIGSITKVEAVFSVYVAPGTFVDDYASAEILLGATSLGTLNFTPAQINAFNTQTNQGLLVWDATALRGWTFSDFVGSNLDLKFMARKTGSVDGQTLYIDAMGFRVTTDQLCGPSDSTTINPLPLTDTYEAAKLQYVSSTPPADSSAPLGTLSWDNLGPLYPGGTKSVVVTFRALEPSSTPMDVTNVATVNSAEFANGTPANTGVSTVTVPLNPAGSLAGVVWSDLNNNGWAGTTGYEGTDTRIPGATVTLYGCQVNGVMLYPASDATRACTAAANGGTWVALATQTTDANGAYLFGGLRNGYYYTAVTPSSIATSGIVQRGDVNEKPVAPATARTCTTCDSQSNATNDNLNAVIGTISNANDVTNVNFGYSVSPVLFGTVWEDINGDGIKGANEPLLTGSVSLYTNATCTAPAAATATLVNGAYRFSGLTATSVTYCLRVNTGTLPAGPTWTETGETDGTVNNTIVKVLSAGEISGSHDFGFQRSGSSTIGDTLFYDWDGDAVQDATDEGMPNVTVRLYRDLNNNGVYDPAVDALVTSTTTNASGNYLFTNVAAGNYVVAVDTSDPDFPANVYQTADPSQVGPCSLCDNQSAATGVDGTSAYLTHDYGYSPTGGGSIGDTVWYDKNGDGIQSGVQETGLAGMTVRLLVDLNGDGTFVVVETQQTDADGHYLFTNLPAGTYHVEVLPNDPQLPTDAFGLPLAPTTPTTRVINLPTNTSNLTADFGFAPLGAIGDTIYWDANGNGDQDWSEGGIPGVTVTLCSDLNGDGDCADAGEGPVASTTTDADGHYLFTGLSPLPSGSYLVSVGAIPGNPTLTADPSADGVPCTDVAAVGCDGLYNVPILPGSSFMGADFGYQPLAVVGDTLFIDVNHDGVQDAGDTGIPGVTVQLCLTTAPFTCYTTTTDIDGHYSFINVPNGSYTVTVDTADPDFPGGLTPTYDPDGTPNGSTTVTVSGGAVTAVGGTPCTNCSLNADFGYQYTGGALSLSGTVCLDGSEADRVCGLGPSGVVTATGEAAYAGSTVYLYNSSGDLIATTTTSASGDYAFNNLASGTYFVSLSNPEQYLALVTQTGDTPASLVQPGVNSAFQQVTVNANVQGVDFAYQMTVTSDFGDLPTSYSTTKTGRPDGPRHILTGPSTLYLGATAPDSEADGQPTAPADGDGADEDGVTFDTATWVEGAGGGAVSVSVNGSGWLVGWVDLDKNGLFDQANELIVSQAVSTGVYNIAFDIPSGMIALGSRNVYSRFRLLPSQPIFPSLAYTGAATGGEVEDYLMLLPTPTAVDLIAFNAQAQGQAIRVRWLTSKEEHTSHFDLYRATSPDRASAVRVTASSIPAHGAGIYYGWSDTSIAPNTTYYYWLVESEVGGATNEYGPTQASTVQATAQYSLFLPLIQR